MSDAIESLWTVADVAIFLRCSKSLVYKKAEAGLMPCVRLGALLRFDPEEIRAWAKSGGAMPTTNVLRLQRKGDEPCPT